MKYYQLKMEKRHRTPDAPGKDLSEVFNDDEVTGNNGDGKCKHMYAK